MSKTKKPEFIDHFSCTQEKGCEYIAIIPPDLGLLPTIFDKIEHCFEKKKISSDDKFQIQIISEELIANALLATAEKKKKSFITVHILLAKKQATIIVMDSGGGIKTDEVKKLRETGKDSIIFLDSLKQGEKSTEINKYGRNHLHKRFGKGLSIVGKLTDVLEVLFHDGNGNFSPRPQEQTVGTVFLARYIYKY